MAINLFTDNYASSQPSALLAAGEGARAVGVALAAGEGVLRRGSVLIRGTDGTYTHAAASDIVAGSFAAVLDEETALGAAPVVKRAYINGVFMHDQLIFKSGNLTPAVNAVLRTQGIQLDSYQKADGAPSAVLTPGT